MHNYGKLGDEEEECILAEVTRASHSNDFYEILGTIDRKLALRLEDAVNGIIAAATAAAYNLGIRRVHPPE